jgi:uncharacterized repeat protein (TIGR01451 family)
MIYDWGYPVVPTDMLTPEVIIGWGYGCEDKNCRYESFNKGKTSRSAVFVAPVARCDVYVDFDNKGVVADYKKYSDVTELRSLVITDTDEDMSGARIFAVEKNSGVDGPKVNIAAAWGQEASFSGSGDESALDLGTVVLPFYGFAAIKNSEAIDMNGDGLIGPNDKIKYTIRVSNVGQGDVATGSLVIKDTLDANVDYVAGSLTYNSPGPLQQTYSGTAFPLAGNGITNPFDFEGRGGTHDVVFEVIIKENAAKETIVNNGSIAFDGTTIPFTNTLPLDFVANVKITKTVYAGRNGVAGCDGVDEEEGQNGNPVTWCFKIKNTGNTYLKSVTVGDAELPFNYGMDLLAPNQEETMSLPASITANQRSVATVRGNPSFANGDAIPGLEEVTDTSDAGVKINASPTFSPTAGPTAVPSPSPSTAPSGSPVVTSSEAPSPTPEDPDSQQRTGVFGEDDEEDDEEEEVLCY